MKSQPVCVLHIYFAVGVGDMTEILWFVPQSYHD